MTNLRVGVVGAGVMGGDHALSLHRSIRGPRSPWVADLELARARASSDAIPGAKPTDDPVGSVHDDAVDAVVIASSDATHADLGASSRPSRRWWATVCHSSR